MCPNEEDGRNWWIEMDNQVMHPKEIVKGESRASS